MRPEDVEDELPPARRRVDVFQDALDLKVNAAVVEL